MSPPTYHHDDPAMTASQATTLITAVDGLKTGVTEMKTDLRYIAAGLGEQKGLLAALDLRVDSLEREFFGKLAELRREVDRYKNQFAGSWKTLTVLGSIAVGVGGIIGHLVSTLVRMSH